MQKFRCFFDNSQIGPKVSVKNVISSEPAQGRYYFPFHIVAKVFPEGIAKGHADGRRRLKYDDLVRIIDRFLNLSPLRNGRRRSEHAGQRALAAVDTDRDIPRTF